MEPISRHVGSQHSRCYTVNFACVLILGTTKTVRVMYPLLLLSPMWGVPRLHGFCSQLDHVWVRNPTSIQTWMQWMSCSYCCVLPLVPCVFGKIVWFLLFPRVSFATSHKNKRSDNCPPHHHVYTAGVGYTSCSSRKHMDPTMGWKTTDGKNGEGGGGGGTEGEQPPPPY